MVNGRRTGREEAAEQSRDEEESRREQKEISRNAHSHHRKAAATRSVTNKNLQLGISTCFSCESSELDYKDSSNTTSGAKNITDSVLEGTIRGICC